MINADLIPDPHKLSNKPLAEAIFELRWKLDTNNADPGFSLLLGRYFDRLGEVFPEVENLPAMVFPEGMTPYTPRHRLRKSKNGWPLTQLGPGILSVNEAEGYTWDRYRPMLKIAVQAFLGSYPRKQFPLVLEQVMLRYINVIPLNRMKEEESIIRFLKEQLHTTVAVDTRLFDNPELADYPTSLNVQMTYPLNNLPGAGTLSFATGMKDKYSQYHLGKRGPLAGSPCTDERRCIRSLV